LPRIVFICTKNQFRSPLAEVMFRNLLTTRNIPGEWIVESAGSWVDKLSPATHEAIIEAKKRGLDLSSHQSKGIEGIHREKIDLFLLNRFCSISQNFAAEPFCSASSQAYPTVSPIPTSPGSLAPKSPQKLRA
jgi:hypothetical protein